MADKKTELMAQFYAQCQQKGYTNMRDDKQSLKAKVIANDLKLSYGNIEAFYNKAKTCYEQVQAEKEEAQKQRKIQQQEEAQERARRQVNGELLATLSDRAYESDETTSVRIYIRPDNSVYYTINNGSKMEGAPEINIKEGGVVLLTYHPSKAVYTGATVGGITTGGVHYTQSGYTAKQTKSGKGDIEIVTSMKTFTLAMIKVTDYTCNLFKRDEIFKSVVRNKEIKCYVESELADAYYSTVKSAGLNYQQITYALTAAADARRLSFFECERITHLLGRIVHGQFPPSDEQIYASAKALENASTSGELLRAINQFKSILDYKDAAKRIKTVEAKFEEILQAEKEQAILKKEARKKHRIKVAILLMVVAIVAVGAITAFNKYAMPAMRYNAAEKMMENQQYSEAILAFQALGDYKDSNTKITECNVAILGVKYNDALALIEEGKYDEAISAFMILEGHEGSPDCREAINECKYQKAILLLEQKEWRGAYAMLQEIPDYKDSSEYLHHFYLVPSSVHRKRNGETASSFVFIYTDDGKISSAYCHLPVGSTNPTYEFDTNGVLIRENWMSGWYYTYVTNGDGTITTYSKDTGTPARKYDKFGNILSYYDETSGWNEYKGFEYDAHCNRSDNAINNYDANGTLLSVQYKKGNLRIDSEIEYEYLYLPDIELDMDLIWKNFRLVCNGEIWYN